MAAPCTNPLVDVVSSAESVPVAPATASLVAATVPLVLPGAVSFVAGSSFGGLIGSFVAV